MKKSLLPYGCATAEAALTQAVWISVRASGW